MLIEIVQTKNKKKYAVELWGEEQLFSDWENFKEPYPEDTYVEINAWCIESLGYHARTAYNRFEFKQEKDLTLFILKWGSYEYTRNS